MLSLLLLLLLLLTDEYTRVQLHKTENIEGSDYINANYVQVLSCDCHVTCHVTCLL